MKGFEEFGKLGDTAITMMTTKNDNLKEILDIGNVILVTAEALVPPSGLGELAALLQHYIILDPLPNGDQELEEEYNLMPVLFRTIVPLETVKLIVKLRQEPTGSQPQEEQEGNDRDEETKVSET